MIPNILYFAVGVFMVMVVADALIYRYRNMYWAGVVCVLFGYCLGHFVIGPYCSLTYHRCDFLLMAAP